ncbi:MAG: hypothetical protein ACK56I_17845, partial [bacterium]
TMLGEFLDRLARDGVAAEEVTLERQDAHRLAEFHEGLHAGSKNFLVHRLGVTADGFVAVQFGLREGRLHLAKQAEVGGGGRGTHDDSQTGTGGLLRVGGCRGDEF